MFVPPAPGPVKIITSGTASPSPTPMRTKKTPKDKSPGGLKPLSGDPAGNILSDQRQALRAIFAPATVAVVGANDREGSVGRTVLWNLITHPFGGTVFPVNPLRANVLGIKAYRDLASLPEPVDLAVIVTPAPTVPAVIADCVRTGVKGAIVISAGFKETGAAGAELERQVLAEARRGRLRIIGPNCLGVMNPQKGLNATFASAMARPGNVAFLSQSGALCTAVLDWSLRESVGFSLFVSVGSMLDVDWGDLILHVGDDPRTHAVLIYMESIGDARAFLSAAREVAMTKPIIVIKPGRTEGAAKAAASHTGALAGQDQALEAAFRRSGVLRVASIEELFYSAESLAKQPRPRGPRLAIVTNAGGPAVLATDALLTLGGQLAELSPETISKLDGVLPPAWSHGNPVDVLGDADPARYARAVEIVAADPSSDGLLVILTPQAMTDPTRTAEDLKPYTRLHGKPFLASWMGGADVAAGESILNRASVPTFAYPDIAARVFTSMWRYADNLRLLYETPMLAAEGEQGPDVATAGALIETARRARRVLLTEAESKRLLATYGIPTVPTRVAADPETAARVALELGFPVVAKLHSQTITHKSDVDGVRLGLVDADAVRGAWRDIEAAVNQRAGPGHFQGITVQPMVSLDGYELILGSSIDQQFGPVLLFGAGGRLVEVIADRALALPPLTSTLARRMMERTTIYRALQGVRGQPPIDLRELEQLLVRFSHLVVEQPRIKEIDINPLLASAKGLVALDARVVLHPAEIPDADLPQPAIRPYPRHYISEWRTRDGLRLTIRPIRPEDEPRIAEFHGTLSERSVYMRYLHPIAFSQRVAHDRLARICFIDYDREMVLVAETAGTAARARQIVGVGRLTKLHWSQEAEFALLVSDQFQRRGLGTELLRRLLDVGRAEKLRRIEGYISAENLQMIKLATKLGFRTSRLAEDPSVVEAILDL
jgi:acetyltransferase